MTRSVLSLSIARAGIAAAALAGLSACVQTGGAVRIDDDDIGGVVSGPGGPEAGSYPLPSRVLLARLTTGGRTGL